MRRIVVVGSTGSGKSTLAEQLAELFGIPFVELDALFWESNWQEVEDEVFRHRVSDATSPESWVAAGNYSRARDILWPRADTIIWLDYFIIVNYWRLFRRSFTRAWYKYDIWGTGNTESFRKQFLSRDSLFVWLWTSYPKHRRQFPALFADPQYSHLDIIHLRSPLETSRWLKRTRSNYGA